MRVQEAEVVVGFDVSGKQLGYGFVVGNRPLQRVDPGVVESEITVRFRIAVVEKQGGIEMCLGPGPVACLHVKKSEGALDHRHLGSQSARLLDDGDRRIEPAGGEEGLTQGGVDLELPRSFRH